MKDKLQNLLSVGDRVVYAPGGSYAGVSIGKIIGFTPKQVKIEGEHRGRHMLSSDIKIYYTYSDQILKIEKN
jgi:hypothetical protein